MRYYSYVCVSINIKPNQNEKAIFYTNCTISSIRIDGIGTAEG